MKYKTINSLETKSLRQTSGFAFLISIIIIGIIILGLGIYGIIQNNELINKFNYLKDLAIFTNTGSAPQWVKNLIAPGSVDYFLNMYNYSLWFQSYPYIGIGIVLIVYAVYKILRASQLGLLILYPWDYAIVIVILGYAVATCAVFLSFEVYARVNVVNPNNYDTTQFVLNKFKPNPGGDPIFNPGGNVSFAVFYEWFNYTIGAIAGYSVVLGISSVGIIYIVVLTILILMGRISSISLKMIPLPKKESQALRLEYKPKLGGRKKPVARIGKPMKSSSKTIKMKGDAKYLEHKKTRRY